MALIQLRDAELTFRVRRGGRVGLKEFLVASLKRTSDRNWMTVHTLRGINLEIHDKERIGIIGHNGAGKSSLLKLLAGVYPPTAGKCVVNGDVSSLFDITLGFEPEATGWENISFRGYLQGETPKSLARKKDAIAEFSGLGDMLNMPVRYYSAGMTVRLGFSIATAVEPQILLVDEVLGAGDREFQERARDRINRLVKEAAIVVMVSHDLNAIAGHVDRIIWLDHGQIHMDGAPRDVIREYKRRHVPTNAKAA